MSSELHSIDISDSSEILGLAEEVQRTGVGRLLKRGEQALAVLTPVSPQKRPRSGRRRPTTEEPDTILDIVGIGASVEPTDIAQHEREYLAEAYEPNS